MREIPGASALLKLLAAHPRWYVAIATGGWSVSASFKLASDRELTRSGCEVARAKTALLTALLL
jgi:hypothetical protein